MLPALHIWLWLPQLRIARAPVRLGLFALGLIGPAIVVLSLAWRYGLGFDAPWYLLELVGIGYVSPLAVLPRPRRRRGRGAARDERRRALRALPRRERAGPARAVPRARPGARARRPRSPAAGRASRSARGAYRLR